MAAGLGGAIVLALVEAVAARQSFNGAGFGFQGDECALDSGCLRQGSSQFGDGLRGCALAARFCLRVFNLWQLVNFYIDDVPGVDHIRRFFWFGAGDALGSESACPGHGFKGHDAGAQAPGVYFYFVLFVVY